MPHSVPFKVKALYEYDVEQEDDLPFQPGEVINVTEVCDDQWYYGYYEANGSKLEGMFPKNYVEDIATTAPVKEDKNEPELALIPQPKVKVAPVEDDWGSDTSDDEGSLPTQTKVPVTAAEQVKQEVSKAPTDKEIPKEAVESLPAPTKVKEAKTKPADSSVLDAAKNIDNLKIDAKDTNSQKEKPVEEEPAKFSISKPLEKDLEQLKELRKRPDATKQDQSLPDQMPDITPGESLSSNFKSRRGIFNQSETETESEPKAAVKPKAAPQKLQRWQPQQEETPAARSPKDEKEVAPRMSIKERLAMIQQQEQEMQQGEENERKRREQEDEALRIEEERRNRELELNQEKEELNKEVQPQEKALVDEEEIPSGPIEGHAKPPSIPVLPKVIPEEPVAAGSYEDNEEGARKIALRERMARISGLGNPAGISLGMMLGRNPNSTHSGGTGPRRVKKKDVSAMSDLERELYLASVEYDEAHGDAEAEDASEEQIHANEISSPSQQEDSTVADIQDIPDDETLIGARDTDAETLAESDSETQRQDSVLSEPVTYSGSVPARAPIASPSRGPGPQATAASVPPTVASAPPVPVPNAILSGNNKSVEESTPVAAPTAALEESTHLHPTDTTGVAADEENSSSDDEYSDASPTAQVSTPSAPVVPSRVEAVRQHELHLRNQSDSETGYEADDDTDNPANYEHADILPVPEVPGLNRGLPHAPAAPQSLPQAPVTKSVPPVPSAAVPPQQPVSSPTRDSPTIPAAPSARAAPPPPSGATRAPPAIPTKAPVVPPQSASTPNAPQAPQAPRAPQPPRVPQTAPPATAPQLPQKAPPGPSPVAPLPPQAPQTHVFGMRSPPPVPAAVPRPAAPPQTRSPPAVPSMYTSIAAPKSAPVPVPSAKSPPASVSNAKSPPLPPAPAGTGAYHHLDPHDIDLDLGSLWFVREDGVPPSVDPSKVSAEFEHNEANKRGRVIVTHDVYILYSDLSQIHITVTYDKADPSSAHGTQKYIASPKPDTSVLGQFATTIGSAIATAASRHSDIAHTSAFVKSLFKEVPAALPPIKGSFGVSIYENFGAASVHQIDMISPGDIAVLVEASFSAPKPTLASPLQKHQKTIGNAVYVVKEWDGAKKKLRVFDSKKESFRLEDLKSGMIKIYRPVGREFVGW